MNMQSIAFMESEKMEKFSGAGNLRDLIEAVAGPRTINDSRESWLRRAARLAGTSYRQAKALFYGEITDPDHRTVTRFKRVAGRHEAIQLAEQYERIAMALHHRDADFYEPDVAAARAQAHRLRNLVSTGDGGET
jgi:hypothetical protein